MLCYQVYLLDKQAIPKYLLKNGVKLDFLNYSKYLFKAAN